MTVFDAIRQRVTAREAAERYGLQISRNGRALCPWHDDHRPDLAFYGDHCACHACHHGGDAVALAAQVLGLSQIEAARRINADFDLGLDMEAPVSASSAPRIDRRKQMDEERRRWGMLCDVVHEADARLESFTDGRAWDDPVFMRTLEARAKADLQLEIEWEGLTRGHS